MRLAKRGQEGRSAVGPGSGRHVGHWQHIAFRFDHPTLVACKLANQRSSMIQASNVAPRSCDL